MFSSLRARSLSWHTFWLSVRHSHVVNYCSGTWNNHFVARTFGTKRHAGRLLSKKRKKIVFWMENTLYANRILFKDLLIFVEPTSPERSVLVLTQPPSERGEQHFNQRKPECWIVSWLLASEEITRWGNEFEVENDKVVNSCRILTLCVVWYLNTVPILCSFLYWEFDRKNDIFFRLMTTVLLCWWSYASEIQYGCGLENSIECV